MQLTKPTTRYRVFRAEYDTYSVMHDSAGEMEYHMVGDPPEMWDTKFKVYCYLKILYMTAMEFFELNRDVFFKNKG